MLLLALMLWRLATGFGSVTVLNGALRLRPHAWRLVVATSTKIILVKP